MNKTIIEQFNERFPRYTGRGAEIKIKKIMLTTKPLTYKSRRITTIQSARQDAFTNGFLVGMVLLALTLLFIL